MATATKAIPLVFEGHSIEPREGLFVTDLGKNRLQMLYDTNPPVLRPSPVRRLWKTLKDGNINPQLFYNEELHKPLYGAEAGDLKPMIEQLYQEMYDNFVVVNGVFVVDNKSGLVLNLGNTQLPAFVTPVGVYTEKPVTPKSKHGMTLDEFKQAGGRLVAYRAFPAGQYQLRHDTWTPMPEGVEQVGVMPGDNIYANLNSKHGDGVKTLVWYLLRPGERSSDLYAFIGLDGRISDWGVLRGRKLNATGSY